MNGPELVEDDRRREDDAADQRELHVVHERVVGRERLELGMLATARGSARARPIGVRQSRSSRGASREGPADDGAADERDARAHEALAELADVLPDRHLHVGLGVDVRDVGSGSAAAARSSVRPRSRVARRRPGIVRVSASEVGSCRLVGRSASLLRARAGVASEARARVRGRLREYRRRRRLRHDAVRIAEHVERVARELRLRQPFGVHDRVVGQRAVRSRRRRAGTRGRGRRRSRRGTTVLRRRRAPAMARVSATAPRCTASSSPRASLRISAMSSARPSVRRASSGDFFFFFFFFAASAQLVLLRSCSTIRRSSTGSPSSSASRRTATREGSVSRPISPAPV